MAEPYNNPDYQPPKPSRGLFWPIVLFVLMVGALQWPKIKEMVYGSHEPEAAFKWEPNLAAAKLQAEETGKPMLLVFSASWCPPCKTMKRQVWPDAEVGRVVQADYVPLYVDVDLPEHADLVERYQINGIPSVFLVNKEGDILRKANFMSRDEALSFLSR